VSGASTNSRPWKISRCWSGATPLDAVSATRSAPSVAWSERTRRVQSEWKGKKALSVAFACLSRTGVNWSEYSASGCARRTRTVAGSPEDDIMETEMGSARGPTEGGRSDLRHERQPVSSAHSTHAVIVYTHMLGVYALGSMAGVLLQQ